MPGTSFSTSNWTGYDEQSWTNPSSDLTNFSGLIDISTLSASWKSNVQSDGADIRITNGSNSELAYDLIDWAYNAGSPTGLIRFLWAGTLSSSGTQNVRVWAGYSGTATSYDSTETYGSDNAYASSVSAYWPLYESSGTRTDRTANSNDLADNNTVLGGTGKIGNASDFEFDNDEFLDISDNTSLSTGDIDFTLSGIVNAESWGGGNSWVLSKRDGSQNEYQILRIASSTNFELWVWDSTASANVGSTSPSLSTWYHLFAWHDSTGDELGIQVDKGTPDNLSHSTGVNDSDSDFVIGARPGGLSPHWDGLIQHVWLDKRVWSSAHRAQEYDQCDDQSAFWGTWAWTTTGGGGDPDPPPTIVSPNVYTPDVEERVYPAIWSPGLNFDSEQARGLILAAPMWEGTGKPVDYVRKIECDTEPNWSYTTDISLCATTDGTSAYKFNFGHSVILDRGFSICAWVRQRNAPKFGQFEYFGLGNDGTSTPFRIYHRYMSTSGGGLWDSMDGTNGDAGCGGVYFDTLSQVVDVVSVPQNRGWIFVYGRCFYRENNSHPYSISGCTNDVQPDDVDYVFFGNNSGSTGAYLDVKDLRLYDRTLTDGELIDIRDNPSDLWVHRSPLAVRDYLFVSGLILGGDADTDTDYVHTPSGRFLFKGSAATAGNVVYTPEDGMIFGGSAATQGDFIHTPSGRFLFKGSADIEVSGYAVTGAFIFGGSADIEGNFTASPEGGIIFGSPSFPLGFALQTTVTVPAAQLSGDLEDFVLSLVLSVDGTQDSVYVTDSTGGELYSHFGSYDSTTGKMHAWVRTDLDSTSDNIFYIYHN